MKFKVGDRVQFKSWEEMEKEFGLDTYGNIRCASSFTPVMKYLCNTSHTIASIYNYEGRNYINFIDNTANYWTITSDMIKKVSYDSKKVKVDKHDDNIDAAKYGLGEFRIITLDDKTYLDKQIKWYEEKLAKLKAQKEKEKWQFTEDEKVILRNISGDFKYITRDRNGNINLFTNKPIKFTYTWRCYKGVSYHLSLYYSLFTCIQWEDTEPCEFRKYLGE